MRGAALLVLLALSAPAGAATPDDLLDAVRRGDLAGVKAALDAGVPVDAPFRYERTALSFAAARGNLEIVRLLLDRGADPDKKDTFYGATPISSAINEGHASIVRLLLERGAPVGPGAAANGCARRQRRARRARAREGEADAGRPVGGARRGAARQARRGRGAARSRPAPSRRSPPTSQSTRRRSPATPASTAAKAATAASCASSCARASSSASPAARRAWCWARRTRRRSATRRVPGPGSCSRSRTARPSGFVVDFGSRQVSYRRVADEAPKEKP